MGLQLRDICDSVTGDEDVWYWADGCVQVNLNVHPHVGQIN